MSVSGQAAKRASPDYGGAILWSRHRNCPSTVILCLAVDTETADWRPWPYANYLAPDRFKRFWKD